MDILEYIKQMQEMYGEDVITTADKINRPEPKREVQEIELFNEFNRRNPKADGGQLVAPSVDGSRPGYGGERKEKLKNFLKNKKTIKASVLRDFILNEVGYERYQPYNQVKTLFPNLKIEKDIQMGFKRGEKIKMDKKTLKVADQYAALLNKNNPKSPQYVSSKNYADLPSTEKSKILYILKANDNKFTKNYSEQLRFNPKKEKKIIEAFNLKKDAFDKHGKYGVPIRIGNKENPKYIQIKKFIKGGFKFKKILKSEMITPDQQEFVKNNFELPEGKKWNFKSQDNPKGYKYGVTGQKGSGTVNLARRIESKLTDKNLSKLSYIAADTATTEGWMMNAMNRLYENEIKARVKFKDLTYQPKFKKGTNIIIGFIDNTAAGDGGTYYGLKRNTPEDATLWTAHGDHEKINKFLKIAKGAQVDEPGKLLQKILDDKGITKLMGDKNVLTLNDILSHERYYKNLSDIAPKTLIERQIVLHHTKRVGGDLAQAAATKDLQLLTGTVNNEVRKLETIASNRKLSTDEKLKLKKYGAKIVDFDGKVVGGGYLDPERQFASIEKKALQYAKGKDFNVKTVASYLERLGCDKAAGGRILMSNGGATLTKCANKGTKRLEQIILRGGAKEGEQELAKKILQAGRGLKGAVALRGLFGPAALAFTAATEAGFVGYDMLSKGKTFKEAVGDSVFNYMLGDKTKIDTRKERDKRLRDIGGGPPSQAFRAMSEKEMGKIAAYESALSDIDELENIFNKDAIAKQKLQQAKKFYPAVVDKRQKEADAVRADIRDLTKTGTEQRLMNVDYEAGAKALKKAQDLITIDQLTSSGPKIVGKALPMTEESRQDAIAKARGMDLALKNANPGVLFARENRYMYPFGFASGGLANLTDTIPPESGPMSQGLRSLYNNDMDY